MAEPILDSRQLAIVIWIVVIAMYVFTRATVRSAAWGVVRTAASPKLSLPLLCMAAYIAGLFLVVQRVGLWRAALVGEVAFWFVGTALVMFVSVERASDDPRFFRRTTIRLLSVSVVLQFITNLYTFGLLIELVLVPILVVLGMMAALAETQSELKPLRGCLQVVLVVAGLALFVYSVAEAVADSDSFATSTHALEFALPLALTVLLLPYIYAVATYMNYDSLFSRLRFQMREDVDSYRYARRKLIRFCRVRLRRLVRASRAPWWSLLPPPVTRSDIDHVIAHLRSGRRHALATPLRTEDELRALSALEKPGWEWVYFSKRLDTGVAVAMSASVSDESGRAYELPYARAKLCRTLSKDDDDAAAVVSRIEPIFESSKVEEAFGKPGEAGDADRLRAMAEEMTVVFDEMVRWSARTRSTPVANALKPMVAVHAELMEQPQLEVQEYVDRWNEVAGDVDQLLNDAEEGDRVVSIEMVLTITLDDAVMARYREERQRVCDGPA